MSVIIFVVSIIWVGSAINGGANYLSYLIGMPLLPAKVMTVFAFAIYVFIGGYMAVVYTDAIQAILLFTGFLFIAFMAIPAAGGFENIVATYQAADKAGALTLFGIGELGFNSVLIDCFSFILRCDGRTQLHTCVFIRLKIKKLQNVVF